MNYVCELLINKWCIMNIFVMKFSIDTEYLAVSIDFVRLVEPERAITLLVVTPQIHARRHMPHIQLLYELCL